MKAILTSLAAMLLSLTSFACEVCEKRQPAFLRGITHGAGPEGKLDYVIVTVTILVVLATLFYSVKYLVRPREENGDHIKTLIID
ncbi:MAG: hypothetical protein ABWY16_12655 [Pedobacter sp.]|jgi:hypothetical protein|uniref:hypothetical protein n=1 Tax=Pedobacter sp. TaxID=1411316 RepID=UPI0033951E63